MGVYAVTGGSGKIGGAIIKLLKENGDEVINIDIDGGDICEDLATDEGRVDAAVKLQNAAPDGLDGLVCCAGVNGGCKNLSLIVSLNYFGATAFATYVWNLLEMKKGCIVMVLPNAVSQKVKRTDVAEMLANGADEGTVCALAEEISRSDRSAGHEVYIAAKYALAKWTRRVSATSAARGVRINALAAGDVKSHAHRKTSGAAERALPIPTKFGTDARLSPEEIAYAARFLLGRESSGVNGVVLFADGGTDALLNPDRAY